jgi:MoxR-like ATPase
VDRLTAVREEISKAIVGQVPLIDGVLSCLLCGGHALLEGVPGLGKTALVHAVAQATGLRLSRIQFTPDLMPSDIVGTELLAEEQAGRRFVFEPGPIFAHVILADEINRATPKTQSALLEAMQERSVTVGKQTHALEEPFLVLATQNPLDMEGTYPLPEAQLDRFVLKLHVPFPDRADLLQILERTTGPATPSLKAVTSREDILNMRQTVRQVAVAPHILEWLVSLLESTHPGRGGQVPLVERYVQYGASPRGAQACLLTAKVHALQHGRLHVAQSDLLAVAKPALRHRILLNFEGEADDISTDDVIDEVLQRQTAT